MTMCLSIHMILLCFLLHVIQYRLERAHFSPAMGGEYLSLEVAGLSDKRPSILVGDTLLVLPPRGCGEGEEAVFEGCIHQVLNNKVRSGRLHQVSVPLIATCDTFFQKVSGLLLLLLNVI